MFMSHPHLHWIPIILIAIAIIALGTSVPGGLFFLPQERYVLLLDVNGGENPTINFIIPDPPLNDPSAQNWLLRSDTTLEGKETLEYNDHLGEVIALGEVELRVPLMVWKDKPYYLHMTKAPGADRHFLYLEQAPFLPITGRQIVFGPPNPDPGSDLPKTIYELLEWEPDNNPFYEDPIFPEFSSLLDGASRVGSKKKSLADTVSDALGLPSDTHVTTGSVSVNILDGEVDGGGQWDVEAEYDFSGSNQGVTVTFSFD